MQQLVNALTAEPTRHAATDALCTLLSGGHERTVAADAAPLSAAVAQLHALVARATGTGAGRDARGRDAALLTAVARVTAAAVEGEPSLTALPALADLLQALVEAVPQRGPTYATAVLEVLFAANLEAVGDRAEPLRGPVYVAAVERVLPEAMFPDGFEPGQGMCVPDGEEEMDEDEFLRFRKVEVADLLAQTCSLCGFGCAVPFPLQWRCGMSAKCVTKTVWSACVSFVGFKILDAADFTLFRVAFTGSDDLTRTQISMYTL